MQLLNGDGLTSKTKEFLHREGLVDAFKEALKTNSPEPIRGITKGAILSKGDLTIIEANQIAAKLDYIRQRVLKERFGRDHPLLRLFRATQIHGRVGFVGIHCFWGYSAFYSLA